MSEEKMHVIFFPAWFPTSTNPLAGKFVVDLGKAIKDRADVLVVYIDANPDLKKVFEFSNAYIEGMEVLKFSFRKLENRYLNPINALAYVFAAFFLLFKESKRFKQADINHVHVLTRTAFLPFLLKMFCGIPYVISEHWSRYLPERNTYKGNLRNLITKFFVKTSSGVTTVSDALQSAMAKFGLLHKNFRVISNPLDTKKFSFIEREKNEIFSVLHISGLNDDVKNVSGLLRAAKILCNENYVFELVIIGDDEIEGPLIRNYAQDLKLKNVKFTGKLYGDDLLAYYQKADVFVLNSNFETQSCVVLEAMGCGLPVIATKVGGVPQIMTDDSGILINPKDDQELVKALAKVINGEIVFNKQKIRNHAVANFGYIKVAEDTLNFYHQASKET